MLYHAARIQQDYIRAAGRKVKLGKDTVGTLSGTPVGHFLYPGDRRGAAVRADSLRPWLRR